MSTSLARYLFGVNRWSAVILLTLLVGCSSTTFFYNRLDTLIAWYVSDYVRLNREQDKLFDVRLAQLHDWHRREELSTYIALLDAMDKALEDTVTDTELLMLYEGLLAAAERLRVKMTALAIDFGDQLSFEQRLEFVASIRANQQEWYDERVEMDDDDYRQLLRDRFVDNLADFLGRLNREQRSLIAERTQDMMRLHEPWHEQRTRWLDRLEAALRDNPENWQVPVQQALDSWEDDQSEEYRTTLARNQALTRRLLVDIVNSRTPRQDEHLRRVITDYRSDFASLLPIDDDLVEQ